MAIRPETEFTGKILAGNANYPQGEAKNVTLSGDGTGTPWRARLINDSWGFFQRLLDDAGITPSGNPDTVPLSDYKDSLDIIYSRLAAANVFVQNQRIDASLGVNVAPPASPGDFSIGGKMIGGVVPHARIIENHNSVGSTFAEIFISSVNPGDLIFFTGRAEITTTIADSEISAFITAIVGVGGWNVLPFVRVRPSLTGSWHLNISGAFNMGVSGPAQFRINSTTDAGGAILVSEINATRYFV